MTPSVVASLVWIVLVIVLGGLAWQHRRRRTHLGPGAIGTLDQLLNDERRKAVELIVEQRAEERDPESVDGILRTSRHPNKSRDDSCCSVSGVDVSSALD